MTKVRVLFVDDEPNVLSGDSPQPAQRLRRAYGRERTRGAGAIARSEPFAVIVSDCRMPEMDGIELLQRCSKIAPSSVRHDADRQYGSGDCRARGEHGRRVQVPEQAVSRSDALKQVVAQAVRQYELVTAEKELLEQTLKGSINVLVGPARYREARGVRPHGAAARARRARSRATSRASKLGSSTPATLLSQLGCVNVVAGNTR